MARAMLLRRSIVHHWRTNLAVALGAAVGTAALTGALVVGDSMRASLREVAVGRLGNVDYTLVAPRFFRAALADELAADPELAAAFDPPCPAILLTGAATHAEKRTRANQVNVLGVDQRFWAMNAGAPSLEMPTDRSVILNTALADELGAAVGDDVLLRIGKENPISSETLLGRRDDTISTLRLTVRGIVPSEGPGAFSLQLRQATPRNAFVPLNVLQRSLGREDRVNTMLVQERSGDGLSKKRRARVLDAALRMHVALEDLGLRMRIDEAHKYVSLESESLLLPPVVEEAAVEGDDSRVLAHLANSIRKESSDSAIPYSIVAAIDPLSWDGRMLTGTKPDDPPGLQSGEILLNPWAADDLSAKVGDRIVLSYYVTGPFGRIEEKSNSFTLRGIVPMEGLGGDPGFVPEYHGITDTQNLADWNPPFPVDLRKVRPKDEEYWDKYRTAPKAFITLQDGQRLWADQPERFGRLTSIRSREPWNAELLKYIDVSRFGLVWEPVRRRAIEASAGNTDFGMLFIGFSSFLILSSAMLVALLFRLNMERRSKEMGLLLANGFTPGKVMQLLLCEGLGLAALGSLLGVALAGGYAWLMLAGLRSWWAAAVNAPFLQLHLVPLTMVIGFVVGVSLAGISIAWSVRGLTRQSVRALLSGASGEENAPTRRGPRRALAWAIFFLLGAIAVALLPMWAPNVPAPVTFFGAGSCMLAAGLAFVAAGLRRRSERIVERPGWSAYVRLALRNAPRRRGRSLLTASLIASASFVILSLQAFRLDAESEGSRRDSGTGGFQLFAESAAPISYDLNTHDGREALNILDPALDASEVSFVPFRLRAGEESSCLNLYHADQPRVLGVTEAMIERGGFRFSATLAESHEERRNPWTLLRRSFADGAIPAIGDESAVKWQLHRNLGEDLVIADENGGEVRLRFVALLKNSILQSELLIGEPDFVRLFPSVDGYSFFLVEARPAQAGIVEAALEKSLERFGLDAGSTTQRLADFQSVQNTYLSTFQTLGGLGLLLGTVGLGAVVLRNAWERRAELALLRAVGYRRAAITTIVLVENLVLVALGLLTGCLSAALAVAPTLAAGSSEPPWGSMAFTVLGVFVAAGISGLVALPAAFERTTLAALRSE